MNNLILQAILLVGGELVKYAGKRIGVPVANNFLCKVGIHDWHLLEGHKDVYICRRCHKTDKVRGLDDESEKTEFKNS